MKVLTSFFPSLTRLGTVVWAVAGLFTLPGALRAEVVINEIMYHPLSEDPREEYIELLNRGPGSVNLAGWTFSSGIRFTLPAVTLAAGDYLVVAANTAVFSSKYPGIANVVGGWEGSLSNSDEDIDLDDPSGKHHDSVHYASEGDWARRTRGPVTFNHAGWIWVAEHDGGGKSLELINPVLSNNHGQNWAPSASNNGTPGRPNSALRSNIAPLIVEVSHFPIVPTSSQTVTITARIKDEATSGLTVTLRHRLDGATSFNSTPMFDDGAHGDGLAGDGFYGVAIGPNVNRAVVEFYIQASDAAGNARTWPPPVAPAGTQSANLLYQVNNTLYSGTQPLYLLVMTEAERAELDYLGDTLPDAKSDAQMNGTFISFDETGPAVQYQVGIRNRGHGSRTYRPNNHHIDFPNDNRWKNVRAINLNSQSPHVQILGSALLKRAGVPVADVWAVQVRVNGTNLALSAAPQFGSYAAVESINSDFADDHFPGDGGGNLYRAVADSDAGLEADLYYRGTNPNSYRTTYRKETNQSEDQWGDLIGLTQAFSESPSNIYAAELNRVLDVDEWLRYFAMNALFDNNESGVYMGYGDDYALYSGVNDPRFLLVAHDNDTILGQGDSPGSPTAGIFRAGSLSNFDRFLRGPEFLPLYHATLRGLISTIFSPEQFEPLVDELLGSWVPSTPRNQIKNFVTQRNAHVLSLIPDTVPISTAAVWRYHQGGIDLGTAWRDRGYNDAAWPLGAALFYNESAGLPFPKRTRLDLNGQTTYYFRARINLHSNIAPNLAGLALQLRPVIDDGMVLYLNGQELFRRGMAAGPVTYSTLATQAVGDAILEGPYVVPAPNFVPGENILAVELHQTDPTSTDVVFGLIANLVTSPQTAPPSQVVLNEVLAQPIAATDPDWIELYNRSTSPIDLTEASLSDNLTLPRKWVFPPGTTIAGRSFLIVRCDSSLPPSTNNTGFSLKQNGDDVFLFDTPARGGAVLDSIEFGLQAAGFSVGRIPSGTGNNWALTTPSQGAANSAAALGASSALKINEWMAEPAEGDDWFELFNSGVNPVSLGGLYLSDNPISRTEYRIPALSYIGVGASGFQKFVADSDTSKGAHHVDFKLGVTGDNIVLFDGNGATITSVSFTQQVENVSQGRLPDGAANIVAFPGTATPGASNTQAPRLSVFRVGNQVYIRFVAVAGQRYTLQVRDTTENGNAWTTIREIAPQGSTGPVDSADWILPGHRTRLYRLIQPTTP